ncbi:MAG: class I SAM-dependent methyltransferase, partial [Candidatus Acidiferrum sp.]
MLKRSLQTTVESILGRADVRINGSRAWDIQVHDERFYPNVISRGALGLGESYMDGWWDCADLAQMFCQLLQAHLDRESAVNWSAILVWLKAKCGNRQRKSGATENVHHHYDRGNDLYRNMLGRWMLYSSANWEEAGNLDEAGEAKLEFVCQKLNLRTGQKILDIGCGWGGFAKCAAQRYGVQVVGITLSEEQVKYARQICADLPVEIRQQDYRDLNEPFDHIISLGMLEHVGQKNYRRYMETVRSCLKRNGLFFLNTIGAHESGHGLNPWTDKYIFPGAVLPSIRWIACNGGTAGLGGILRKNPDRLVRTVPIQLGQAESQLQRAILPHVEILSAVVRWSVSFKSDPGLADRAVLLLKSGATKTIPMYASNAASLANVPAISSRFQFKLVRFAYIIVVVLGAWALA